MPPGSVITVAKTANCLFYGTLTGLLLKKCAIMKIITRGEAMRIHQQHPASRLFPFCTGKYRWHGSTETYTGREVQDIPGVLAVFAERRKDSFGPYVRLMSVTLN